MVEALFILFVVLVIVTVVGHGLWCLVAALFRAIADEGKGAQSRCTKCGQEKARRQPRAPSHQTVNSESADLFGMSRQLDRLRQTGAIDEHEFARLKQLVHGELSGRSKPPALAATVIDEPAAAERPAPAEDIVVLSSTDRQAEKSAAASQEPTSTQQRGPVRSAPGLRATTASVAATTREPAQILDAELVDETPAIVNAPIDEAQQHPLDRPQEREQPRAMRPRRTLADLLQAFMEEKNIRWGELLSGLLIVGSAVGLVISLRHTLSEAIPYFPALLFMLGTAAIHAAGNYTLRRWKLESTSRGVLLIATLLVPLNFLAAIVISGTTENQFSIGDPRYWLAVGVGVTAFGTMTYFAGRALMRGGWWRLWVAVMGASIGQLLINRLAGSELSAVQMLGLWLLPAGAFLAATGQQLWQARDWRKLNARRADQLLTLIGVGTFSLAPVVALMIYKTSDVTGVLAATSPVAAAFGSMLLGYGLFVHLRATSSKLAKTQTVGTTLAVIAGLVLVASVGLAWPVPGLLIAVGLTLFLALSGLAIMGRLPWLHTCAAAGGTLSVLVGVHWAVGHLEGVPSQAMALLDSLLTDETSVTFTVLALLGAVIGWLCGQRGRRAESLAYLWSSASLAGLGVAVAGVTSLSAWPLPSYPLATLVFLVNAAALLLTARYLRVPWVSWCGSLLLLIGLVHAVVLNAPIQQLLSNLGVELVRPVVAAALLHAVLAAAMCAVVWRRSQSKEDQTRDSERKSFALPLLISALISSSSTLPFVIAVSGGHFGVHAVYLTVVALIWLSAAVMTYSQASFAVFQILASGTLVLTVCWNGQQFGWWDGSPTSAVLIAVQLSVLACSCILWNGVRKRLRRSARWSRMLATPEVSVEQVLLRALTVVIVSLAVLACLPSIVVELGGTWPQSAWLIEVSGAVIPLWVAFGLVTAATVTTLTRKSFNADLVWLLLILYAAPWLAISQVAATGATMHWLSWATAVCGLLFSLIYAFREKLTRAVAKGSGVFFGQRANQFGTRVTEKDSRPRLVAPVRPFAFPDPNSRTTLRAAILWFTGLPLLMLILSQFGWVLSGGTAAYPLLTIAGPLLVAAAMFIVFALRDGEPRLMMSGSGTLLAAVVLGFVARTVSLHSGVDAAGWIQLTQWLCVAAGSYALGWLGLRRIVTSRASSRGDSLLNAQIALSVGLLLALAAGAAIGIVSSPAHLSSEVAVFGQPLSYLGLALTLVAVAWRSGTGNQQSRIHLIGAVVSVAGVFVAASLVPFNSAGNLVSYHVVEMSQLWLAVAATTGLVFARNKSDARRNSLAVWGSVTGAVAVLLALRVFAIEPQVVWCLSMLWICCGLSVVVGLVNRSLGHAIASLGLVCVSTTLTCPGVWRQEASLNLLAYWNLVGLSVVAGIWLAATVWQQRKHSGQQAFRIHQLVVVGGCVLITLLTGFELCADWFSRAFGAAPSFNLTVFLSSLTALAAVIGLTAATLWDRRAASPLPCLYALGFPVIFFLLQNAGYSIASELETIVALNLGLALLVVVSSYLLSKSETLAERAKSLGVAAEPQRGERANFWLPIVNLVVSVAVGLLSLAIVLTFPERWMRFAGAGAPLVCGVGFAFTAGQVRHGLIRFVSVLLFVVSMVLVGWADIAPSVEASSVLERCVRLLIALSVSVMGCLIVARRLQERAFEWKPTLQKAAGVVGGSAILVLMLVLAIELATFVPGEGAAVNHPYQIFAVALALAGLVAALIAMACRPARDPLNLSERGRMAYVYAAEAVAALFFAHLYLVKPGWFELVNVRYWPFGLMALAFVGVGVGELFQRIRLTVMAEPLQRTAAFLPLIPVAAFWVLAGHERLSFAATGISYSAVLVVVGLLYVMLSVLRQSFVSAVAAAVAGNAALWVFFHDNAFRMNEHPQFWLIPPALSLLVAAQINRRSLPASTLAAIRYACILLIYLSSTAEMIIESASQQLWPPMVLALLALMGAFAGIVMRVRAFLYIGSTFVMLSVVSMVWHAARAIEHVWPWWAFGMATGLFILALFGLFELKRAEVRRLIDRLRQWDR